MESIPPATVVWFRRDLRLSDNPALEAAVARGGPVIAAWVRSPAEEGDSAPGASVRPRERERPFGHRIEEMRTVRKGGSGCASR